MLPQPPIARIRFPLLLIGLISLFCGVWAGLMRLGWSLPAGPADLMMLHGPLMTFGFLGTVVSLERAVALRRAWGYLAPALSIIGTAWLLSGRDAAAGELMLLAAGCLLTALFVVIIRVQPNLSNATLLLAALLWVGGVTAWLADVALVQVVPWWVGFLILTIVGERLELAHMGRLTSLGKRIFVTLVVAFTIALVALLLEPVADVALRLAGAALVGFALWLARFDIARRTVRRPGLPRFVALALLPGYAWLGIGGLVWAIVGTSPAGPMHDAQLHALLLGFVFSMIFGHAPVIFPGVLGIAIPYRRWFYPHLVLLHVGLIIRIAGDLGGWPSAARWGGAVSAGAIALFLVATIGSAITARVSLARRQRARLAASAAGAPDTATQTDGGAAAVTRSE